MTEARYFLVDKGDEWMIRFGDDEFGPYKTRDEAMIFAVDAAKKLGENGTDAEVCIMGDNGHFRSEWRSIDHR